MISCKTTYYNRIVQYRRFALKCWALIELWAKLLSLHQQIPVAILITTCDVSTGWAVLWQLFGEGEILFQTHIWLFWKIKLRKSMKDKTLLLWVTSFPPWIHPWRAGSYHTKKGLYAPNGTGKCFCLIIDSSFIWVGNENWEDNRDLSQVL